MDRKKLIEFLQQYYSVKLEIQKLEEKIKKLNNLSALVGDVVQNGYKRRKVIIGYDFNKKIKIEQIEKILEERREKLLNIEKEVEELFNEIDNSEIRQIFTYRYKEKKSWIQIQTEMGYKHEDTARKKHDRFIKKYLNKF